MDRLRTGDIFEGAVSDFGMSGEGIVKDGAYPVFVPYALLGERVRLRIVHAKKDYAFGEVIEVLTPSNDRIKPKCRHFGKCGGCDLQPISAPLQEEIKRTSLARTLSKTANVSPEIPPVVCGREWEYRNKLALPFGKDRQGRTVLGFYAKRSHRVIPLKECPLHGEWVQDVIAAVMAWFLTRTRAGLHLRSVGESPATADAAGIDITRYKYLATIIGGGISAIGGMVYIMTIAGCVWNHEGLSGEGWLAVALVIFCLWRPLNAIWGSILFGALMILYMRLQLPFIPNQLYKILPYVVTVIVLVAVSMRKKRENQPPASLGNAYFREDR